jgi:hypothetical protein
MTTHVTVAPERFTLVAYDADQIAEIVRQLAEYAQLLVEPESRTEK